MKQISLYGFARCRKCGFSLALPDLDSRTKCQEQTIICPVCSSKLEVDE